MRCLIEDQRIGQERKFPQNRCALPGLVRQKTVKEKMDFVKPSRRQRDHCRTGTRQRKDAIAGSAHLRHQPGTRIRYCRRAGVHDHRDRLSSGKARDHLLRSTLFVMPVRRQQARIAAVVAQQWCTVPRILGGDPGHLLQDFDRALCDIAKVAERRRNDI